METTENKIAGTTLQNRVWRPPSFLEFTGMDKRYHYRLTREDNIPRRLEEGYEFCTLQNDTIRERGERKLEKESSTKMDSIISKGGLKLMRTSKEIHEQRQRFYKAQSDKMNPKKIRLDTIQALKNQRYRVIKEGEL